MKNYPIWHVWNFSGDHIKKGEYVTSSVITPKPFNYS